MKPVFTRTVPRLLLPGLVALAAAAQERALPDDVLAEISPWAWSGTWRAAAGYKDNVTLASFNPLGSPFARAELEVLGWRLPDAAGEVQLYGAAMLTRYTEPVPAGSSEAQWFGRLELSRPAGAHWSIGGSLEGFHLDQFMDLSATEAERFTTKLRSTGGVAAVALRAEAARGGWVELRPAYRRETDRSGLADSQRPGVGLEAGRAWAGGRGEVALKLQAAWQDFDDRRHYSLRGLPLPGTRLSFQQEEADLRLTWRGRADREWRWHSVLLAQRNRDNGTGYYDYLYLALKQEIEWQRGPWRGRVLGRLGRYDYDRRPISSAPQAPVWRKNEHQLEFRLERRLGPRWLAFAEYLQERSRATNPNASYRAGTGLLGVELTH